MRRPYLAMIDYGTGNVHSLGKALEQVGCTVRLTRDPAELASAAGLLLPGVGAYGPAWRRLEGEGLVERIRALVEEGRPLLGVCLGMQLLFAGSDEDGTWPGLGLLPGRASRFPGGVKVPHMGWNRVWPQPGMRLLAGVEAGAFVYFVHSYRIPWPAVAPLPAGVAAQGPAGDPWGDPVAGAVPSPTARGGTASQLRPGDPARQSGAETLGSPARDEPAGPVKVALADYGGPFAAAVERGHVFGTQFHPEKSGAIGLRILRNFGAICGACDPGH
ncbi:MAG TPA: imidazole glycerol phosphate synthase subunit HisH [Thermaerobacter sp.]